MTRWNGYLIEQGKAKPDKKKEDESPKPPKDLDGSGIPINDKGERDHTGTGVNPEDAWKTPEQREQDQANAQISQKDQEEQKIQAEMDKLQARHDLIRTKLGRILATPKEIEELDDERDEQEKLDAKKDQLKKEKDSKEVSKLEEALTNVKKKDTTKAGKKRNSANTCKKRNNKI